MNHKWKKVTSTKHTCKVCECNREIIYIGNCKTYWYDRSGIIYSQVRPSCIDWKIENNKTID